MGTDTNTIRCIRLYSVGFAQVMIEVRIRSTVAAFSLLSMAITFLGCPAAKSDNAKWKTVSSSQNSITSSEPAPEKINMTGKFTANLPEVFQQPSDDVGRKLLKEYGAVFVTKGGAVAPKAVVFKNESEVSAFQSAAGSARETISGVTIELQPVAMKALKEAVSEAQQNGVTITPRGTDAAKRSYQDTVELWASRVDPGLKHWTEKGRITADEAKRIAALSPYEQVPEIFRLEDKGIWFSKDLSKPIIYSVAPPGSSQHLSMLALDVTENENPKVRSILAKHGWFQTVVSDTPHFTFLGIPEGDLPKLGLKKVTSSERTFWIPDI
jgi:D-alanyl-D-alanine carboxypeptidase